MYMTHSTRSASHPADILIYDEERDTHARVSFGDALLATGLFEFVANGKHTYKAPTAPDDAAVLAGGMTLADWGTGAAALLAASLDGTAVPATAKDVVVCVARPFIEHSMLSAILTVAGADTGATLFGPSDMRTPRIRGRTHTVYDYRQTPTFELCSCVLWQRSRPTRPSRRSRGMRAPPSFLCPVSFAAASHTVADECTSVWCNRSHYTGHFKSVITKPQNVFVMRDVMANGYRAGGNTRFFGLTKDGYDAETARTEIGARLNFEADAGEDPIYASMLAFPMDIGQADKIHNEITVTSRLLPWETHAPNNRDGFPGGAAMYNYYKKTLNLEQIHYGEDLRASQHMEYMSQVRARGECFALGLLGVRAARDTPTIPDDSPPLACTGLDQQLALLHGPLPLLRPGHQGLHRLPCWRWPLG